MELVRHNPPLLVRANGATERLDPTGMVVGLMPDAQCTQASLQLGVGDTLVLFTDGVTEAVSPSGNEFGDARLEQLVTCRRRLRPAELETLILQEVDRFTGVGPQQDDITLVVAHVRAPDLPSMSSHGPRSSR